MKGRLERFCIKPLGRDMNEPGFTLLEMLVVLIIIALIASLVGPRIFSALSDAKVKTARIQIENLSAAVDMFSLDVGRYPSSEEGLPVLMHRPNNTEGWHGPYLRGTEVPKDPWGHPFVYKASRENLEPYEIFSNGEDGKSFIKSVNSSQK